MARGKRKLSPASLVPGHSDKDARKIVPLIHVCVYWRESIITAPENRSMISSDSESLAALSLEQSKAFPLGITLDMAEAQG